MTTSIFAGWGQRHSAEELGCGVTCGHGSSGLVPTVTAGVLPGGCIHPNPAHLIGAGARVRLSSPYGYRIHPTLGTRKFHNGADLAIPQGTPLFPIFPGRVVKTYINEDVNGTGLTIDHGDGWRSSYVHMSALYVKPGDWVDRSRPMGRSGGKKGTWGAGRSTGPHLHLIVRYKGDTVDPVPLIDWAGYGIQLYR